MGLIRGLAVLCTLAMLVAQPVSLPAVRSAQAAAPPAADACAGAATATNNVIHFYLAVDRRRFASAYQCLTPAERRRLPYGPFVAGYARTVTSRLVLADSDVPNGDPVDHVTFDLHAVDRTARGLVASVFMGHWVVDKDGRLERGVITSFRHATVAAIPPTNVADVFAYARRVVLNHIRADVTGDKKADDIYVTSGIGCASCHAQQIWIYSLGRLVFQQEVDDAEVRVARDHAGLEVRTDTPNTPGIDSCCPTERTFEQWAWTPFGFVLRSQRFVQQHG